MYKGSKAEMLTYVYLNSMLPATFTNPLSDHRNKPASAFCPRARKGLPGGTGDVGLIPGSG